MQVGTHCVHEVTLVTTWGREVAGEGMPFGEGMLVGEGMQVEVDM